MKKRLILYQNNNKKDFWWSPSNVQKCYEPVTFDTQERMSEREQKKCKKFLQDSM